MFFSKETLSKFSRNIRKNNRVDKEKLGIEGRLTLDNFLEKIKEQQYKCYVCEQEFKYDGDKWCYFFPSADRINNSKVHSKENVAVSCFFCNVRCWKQINEKKCMLCKEEGHSFHGEIQTKSQFFKKIHHSNYGLYLHLKNMKEEKQNDLEV